MDLLNFHTRGVQSEGNLTFALSYFILPSYFENLLGVRTRGDLISFEKFAHLDSSRSAEFKQRLLLKKQNSGSVLIQTEGVVKRYTVKTVGNSPQNEPVLKEKSALCL